MKTNNKPKTCRAEAPAADETLSKRLGSLQRVQSLCTLAAVAGVLGCVIAALIFQQMLLAAVFFAAAAAGICVGSNTEKKKKALIRKRMGDEFDAELIKFFGPEPQTAELPITESSLRKSCITGRAWEKCEIRNFHEGVYRGVRFSAANVILEHVYQRFYAHDGTTTCREKMFGGIVIRCRTNARAPERVSVRARIEPDEPDGIRISDPEFDRRFVVSSERQSAAHGLMTPQFTGALGLMEREFRDELEGLVYDGDELLLAVNTQYVFADVPDALDARSADSLRQWHTASLRGMCFALDTIIDNCAAFDAYAKE